MPAHMEDKISALEGEIYSKRTWLETHGKHAKKPRPEWEIENKEKALTWLEAIADDYRKSLERSRERQGNEQEAQIPKECPDSYVQS